MSDTVYDATVIAYSNGDLAGRRRGNALDTRLAYLEECLRGERRAVYNGKLAGEYDKHIKARRNDVVDAFLEALDLRGMFVTKATLTRTDYGRAKKLGWPSHDQHLLAAALAAGEADIIVTEKKLWRCAKAVRRAFGCRVIQT